MRELKNVVRKAALVASDLITPEHLPVFASVRAAVAADSSSRAPALAIGEELSLKEAGELAVRDAERRAIVQALQTTKGNKSQAARVLRTDYTTLHSKMKRYGISARDFTVA